VRDDKSEVTGQEHTLVGKTYTAQFRQANTTPGGTSEGTSTMHTALATRRTHHSKYVRERGWPALGKIGVTTRANQGPPQRSGQVVIVQTQPKRWKRTLRQCYMQPDGVGRYVRAIRDASGAWSKAARAMR
jgi:hypothetical protein